MGVDSRETSDSQVTMNKVNSLIRDGLKLKDIKVLKAERKGSYHGKPGVIIASIETAEQKGKLMETKKELKKKQRIQESLYRRRSPNTNKGG